MKHTIKTAADLIANALFAADTATQEARDVLTSCIEAGLPEKQLRPAIVSALVKLGYTKRGAYNRVAKFIGNAFSKENGNTDNGKSEVNPNAVALVLALVAKHAPKKAARVRILRAAIAELS